MRAMGMQDKVSRSRGMNGFMVWPVGPHWQHAWGVPRRHCSARWPRRPDTSNFGSAAPDGGRSLDKRRRECEGRATGRPQRDGGGF